MNEDENKRPTLTELRHMAASGKLSRFHKTACPVCGKMVTNQAMGRAAHRRMHEREKKTDA